MNAITEKTGAAPRIVVADGSKMTRMVIARKIQASITDATVVQCATAAEAITAIAEGDADLITTALSLPDMDGVLFSQHVRDLGHTRFIPIIAISGSVQERLLDRSLGENITDYFDKSAGFDALGAFLDSYLTPDESVTGKLLYVEDSRVVATSMKRLISRHGLDVEHFISVEEAIEYIEDQRAANDHIGADLVLTDVYLKGDMEGGDLVRKLRSEYGYSRGELPIVVLTGDENPVRQAELLKNGANDLVAKPIKQEILIPKLRFQLRLARQHSGACAA